MRDGTLLCLISNTSVFLFIKTPALGCYQVNSKLNYNTENYYSVYVVGMNQRLLL